MRRNLSHRITVNLEGERRDLALFIAIAAAYVGDCGCAAFAYHTPDKRTWAQALKLLSRAPEFTRPLFRHQGRKSHLQPSSLFAGSSPSKPDRRSFRSRPSTHPSPRHSAALGH